MSTKLSEKDRIYRSKVRMKMTKLRAQLKELQQGEGQQSDIDSCNGEIEVLRKELQSLEEGGHTTFIKAKHPEIVEDLNDQIQSLAGERHAIEDFNHTRFLQLSSQASEGDKQTKELREVDEKIKDLRKKLSKCSDSDSEDHLKDELHFLVMEKESIENFTHDHFLENVESMKVKRRSELR